jgi:tRNA modification GTPase
MSGPTHDTICALATARGRSGIAVVRLSGPDARPIAWRRFTPRTPVDAPPPRRMILGTLTGKAGDHLDEALFVYFPAAQSYTGEPVVELHLHGSPVIVEAVLAALTADGARPAEPGEFTRRAFLAGRLDLSQAEAVAELIEARSLAAARAAHRRLTGALSTKVTDLRDTLVEAMALTEAELDFPDEDIGAVDLSRLREAVAAAREGVAELIAGHGRARALAQGAQVALAGRPNAGKSSLLNRLAGARRALVHETAGTTRDLVEAEIVIDGVPVRLVDTAGLRAPEGEIERQGVDLARQTIADADLTVFLIDGAFGITDDDRALLPTLPAARTLVVWNKADLAAPSAAFAELGDLAISAKQGAGVDDLRARLAARLSAGDETGDALLATLRHHELAVRAADRLDRASALLASDGGLELVAIELREAASALGEITGATTIEHVLDAIFAQFCVGK